MDKSDHIRSKKDEKSISNFHQKEIELMACEYDMKVTKLMTSKSTSISDVTEAPRRCSNPHVRRKEKFITTQRSASVEKLFRERNMKVRRNTVSSDVTDSRKSSMKDDVFMSPIKLLEVVSFFHNS